MYEVISLVGGLVLLLLAGDVMVRGAVSLAMRMGIPPLVIGLTIIAFGTSAPELVISLRAALSGSGAIAIGNVVGSNVANVLLVLGIPAVFAVTECYERGAIRSASFMIAITFVFIAFCYFPPLGRPAGIALLALLALFLSEQVRASLEARRANGKNTAVVDDDENSNIDVIDGVEGIPGSLLLSCLFIFVGLAGLPLGAHLVISGASAAAMSWGVSEATIGLTVIAIGTSLPELAATMMAALRGHCGVAVGNVIGSNIFNLLAIMGTTALVAPVPVPDQIMSFEIWAMLAASILLLILVVRRMSIGRTIGFLMTATYLGYLWVVFQYGHAG